MKKTFLPILGLLIVALLLSACQSVGINLGQKTLFEDDFSDTASGWDQTLGTQGESNYRDGRYRIYVKQAFNDVWANPGKNFSDVSVEVDVTKGEGIDSNEFGLTCRSTNTPSPNFYYFVISSSGNYGIGKINNGEQIVLFLGPEGGSDKIKKGMETNRLRADCIGSTLSFYVNGEKLAEVQDTDFTEGDVGILAGTFALDEAKQESVEIFFDNFLVNKP